MALEHGKTLGIVLLELSGDRGKGTCQNASFQRIVLPSISPYLVITQSARNTQWNNIVIKSQHPHDPIIPQKPYIASTGNQSNINFGETISKQ